MTHLEMGKRLQDPTHFEHAVTTFTNLGAVADAAYGRTLLRRTREA